MSAITASTAVAQSQHFEPAERGQGHDNVEWVVQQIRNLHPSIDEEELAGVSRVVLFGGRTPYDFRLRVAQSQLRHDLSPSYWSHVALVSSLNINSSYVELLEVSLEPELGFGMPAISNGVQATNLSWYGDPDLYPGIALLELETPGTDWTIGSTPGEISLLEQFAKQRVVADIPALILRWLAFVWGVGAEPNPLLQGIGVPSAVMVETLLSAAGYEISPGLNASATSPEAFWQSAKWWYPYYATFQPKPIVGRYHKPPRIDSGKSRLRPGQPEPPPYLR